LRNFKILKLQVVFEVISADTDERNLSP